MDRPRIRVTLIAAAVSLLVFAVLVAGCSNAKDQEVSDPSGWFHVAIPENWQADTETGALLIYAKDKLPETADEAFESLSVMVLTSTETSSAAVDDELQVLVNARAAARNWTDFEMAAPEKIEIGGREAYSVSVTAVDDSDRAFAGEIALIRTSDQEALIVSLAPADKWKSYTDEVETLYSKWYWQRAAVTTENEPTP